MKMQYKRTLKSLTGKREASRETPPRWVVYILECVNDSLYTGMTKNISRRLKEHAAGRGGRFTRSFSPVMLCWLEDQPDRPSAARREAQIKRWPREKKLELIAEGTSVPEAFQEASLVFGSAKK